MTFQKLKKKKNKYKFFKKNYSTPKIPKIKIIDFGGAVYDNDDSHTSLINTRQYRAPEVILSCCEWNELTDIWSIACIAIELYSGYLYFETHDSFEHLALIKKAFGLILELFQEF